MTIPERSRWAASVLLVGFVLPSLLQLRIEFRGGHQNLFEAFRSVGAKWFLEFDSLQSVTLVCVVPFLVLALGVLFCAHRSSWRSTIRFTVAGLFLILVVWVPQGIHHLKATYSDDAPPFAIFPLAWLSLASTLLLLILLAAFLAFVESRVST